MHVAKLTHRLAMHFAERLKKPQEGINLLKVSHSGCFSTTQGCQIPHPGMAEWVMDLSASAVVHDRFKCWGEALELQACWPCWKLPDALLGCLHVAPWPLS